MTTGERLIRHLRMVEEYFDRSTSCLEEQHSSYRPSADVYTVAQHVGHVALTVDWFLEGAFRSEGFDMDFEAHEAETRAFTSLAAARAKLSESFAQARDAIAARSDEELLAPIVEGAVMGGRPRAGIVSAIDDHTAHHRGALTVYSRLLGLAPAMPYG